MVIEALKVQQELPDQKSKIIEISEERWKAIDMAKGLVEISCVMNGISVQDYSNNLNIHPHKRSDVIRTAHELNNEIGNPVAPEPLRSALLLPSEKFDWH